MKKNLVSILHKYHLIPVYTEISLFLIVVSFFLIYITERQFRAFFMSSVLQDNVFILGVFLLGILAIIKFAFDRKNSLTKEAKEIIIIFAISLEIIACVLLFFYNIEYFSMFNIILASFNLLTAILLWLLLKQGVINEKNVLSENATYREIIMGVLFILIVFLITKYIFNFAWQVIFSLLISYSISFNELATSSFVRKRILR